MSLLSDPVPPRTLTFANPAFDHYVEKLARTLCVATEVGSPDHTAVYPCPACRDEAKRMVEQ